MGLLSEKRERERKDMAHSECLGDLHFVRGNIKDLTFNPCRRRTLSKHYPQEHELRGDVGHTVFEFMFSFFNFQLEIWDARARGCDRRPTALAIDRNGNYNARYRCSLSPFAEMRKCTLPIRCKSNSTSIQMKMHFDQQLWGAPFSFGRNDCKSQTAFRLVRTGNGLLSATLCHKWWKFEVVKLWTTTTTTATKKCVIIFASC